jgi:predicted component of type VI protein secretion system
MSVRRRLAIARDRFEPRARRMINFRAMKLLVAKTGPLEGNTYTIGGRTLIGRDAECDIQVIDRGVSRKHACVLEQDDGSVLVRDLVSHNGTLVRGERVVEALLSPGDEITLGDSCFEYRVGDPDTVRTEEIDIKLVSGPAQASTHTATSFSQSDRDEILARVKAERAAKAGKPAGRAAQCCDSPLAAQARAQSWKFCPACGGTIQR